MAQRRRGAARALCAPCERRANPVLYVQAGARWRSFDAARRERFVHRVSAALLENRVSPDIRRIWVGYWSQCEPELGRAIAAQLQKFSAL